MELHARMGDAAFYRQAGNGIAASMERLESIQRELESYYERWQVLESLSDGAQMI